MATNQELLEKAIDSTLLATDGKLAPEQADKFIDFVVDESKIFKEIQFKRMKSLEAKLDFLGVSKRIIRAGIEGTAPSELASVSTSGKTLTTKEVILPTEITYDFLEENIERENIEDHIIRMFAKQFANDLEDLAINGDTQAQNTDNLAAHYYNVSDGEISFLQIFDGWLQIILNDANKLVANYTSGNPTDLKAAFAAMLKLLPNKYKINKADLRLYVPPEVEEEYRYTLGARETSLGDELLASDRGAKFMGIPVVPVPYMPDNTLLLTNPQNLAAGMFREITIEKDKDIFKRVRQYAITAKVGVQVVNVEAAVIGIPA